MSGITTTGTTVMLDFDTHALYLNYAICPHCGSYKIYTVDEAR